MPVPRHYAEETIKKTPSPQMSDEAFGGGVGRTISQAGNVLGRVSDKMEAYALQIQERKDRAKVLEIQSEFNRKLNEKLYGDEGLFLRQGNDAINTFKEFGTMYDELTDEFLERAENENLRMALSDVFIRSRNAYEGQAAKHEAMEIRKAEVAQAEAVIASSIESAINAKGDPEIIEEAIRVITETYTDLFSSFGDEVVVEAIDKAMTQMHVSILNQYMVDDDIRGARAYLDVYGDDMKSTQRTQFEEKISNGERIIWAQETAREIFNKYGIDGEAAALRAIDDQYEGTKQDLLQRYVEGVYTDERKAKRDVEAAGFVQILDGLKDKTVSEALDYVESLDIPETLRKPLLKMVMSGGFSGEVTETTGAAFGNVIDMIETANRPVEEGEIVEWASGRIMDSRLLKMLFKIGKEDPSAIKDLAQSVRLAQSKYDLSSKNIPNFVTEYITWNEEQRGPRDIARMAHPYMPRKAPSALPWKDSEIDSLKKTRGLNTDIREARFVDRLKSYSPKTETEKLELAKYLQEQVVIGYGGFAGVREFTIPRGLMPPNARIANVGTEDNPIYKWVIGKYDLPEYLVTIGVLTQKEADSIVSKNLSDKYLVYDVSFDDWRGESK